MTNNINDGVYNQIFKKVSEKKSESTFEKYSKPVEGFSNGYKFDEFKKGEMVSFWYSDRASAEVVLTEGKVVKIVKNTNAKGVDCIRQVHVEMENNVHRVFGTVAQIKHWIFKKDVVVVADPVIKEKEETAPVIENKEEAAPVGEDVPETEEGEIMWVEKAMSAKNPEVKKLVAEGWEFVTKIWNSEKNMYLAKLQRSEA